MVDLKLIAQAPYNTSNERLMRTFTCNDQSSPLWKVRKKFEDQGMSRITEGIRWNAKHCRIYQSIDLAWDAPPIAKETVPLELYGQGFIDLNVLYRGLEDLKCAEDFCEKDQDGRVIAVNFPKLHEMAPSILRSVILRRVYAQNARFANQFPFLKYPPLGTSEVDNLLAEALTQRIDISTNQWNLRHLFGWQAILQIFLYRWAFAFASSSWRRDPQILRQKRNRAFGEGLGEPETVIVREGVEYVLPHPTRISWDQSAPLGAINADLGPDWVHFWDLAPLRKLKENGLYFNRDKIDGSSTLSDLVASHQMFFNHYFPGCTIAESGAASRIDPARENLRSDVAGLFATEEEDCSIFLNHLYERVVPRDEGLGEYPYPVWMRRTIASDNTTIYAEWMPSTPGVYGGINDNDLHVINLAPAHEIIPFQDQFANILTHITGLIRRGLAQVWAINKDLLSAPQQEYLKKSFKNGDWFIDPEVMFYDGFKARDLGITDPKAIISVIQADVREKVNELWDSLIRLLQVMDRLLNLSPNEIGQPMKSETSATEASAVAQTTETISSAIANGIDAMHHALRKHQYESLVMCSEEEFRVPVLRSYTEETIIKAGLTPEEGTTDRAVEDGVKRARTVRGFPEVLVHDYVFGARDGAERVVNAQAAAVMAQTMQMALNQPDLLKAMGKRRLFEFFNRFSRQAGGGWDPKLTLAEGEPDEIGVSGEVEQKVQELTQLMEMVMQHLAQKGIIPNPNGPQQPAQGGGMPPGAEAAPPQPMQQAV